MVQFDTLFSLKGHTAIITGSTRGIGRGIAEYVAAAGADLAIVGTTLAPAEQVASELQARYGVRTCPIACDVRDSAQVDRMIQTCKDALGTPDLLLNNAGITHHLPATEVTDEQWKQVIDVNLNGVFYCCRAFARQLMAEGKKGSIVNLASNASVIVPMPQPQASYNASKAGVVMLTKSLAMEWAQQGIRVNSISPGYVMTELISSVRQDWIDTWVSNIPVGRMGTPDELAGAVLWLFSDMSSFAVGTDIVIDGGFSCV
ncbi:SDR family oxidoreductase [Eubacteriales bacterium OttesenSCG-928-N13]|nr:SDR family oxidoreductase [Eubacteriales bacterium OttesenSCG-928-N13]